MSNSATLKRSSEYIDSRYFLVTMTVACLLHLMVIFAWHIMPKTEVVDIPVRTLNIKLGDSETLSPEELQHLQPKAENGVNVENAISRLVRDQEIAKEHAVAPKPIDKTPAPKATAEKTSSAKVGDTAKQFIRESDVKPAKGAGSVLGNSNAKNAEMMSRYEQMISLWILKFQTYPQEARNQNMQGETVVRVRIDRRGNIGYYALERTTGYLVLDRAAIDMIRRANPVPAVPNDYPPGDTLEFLVPVKFSLQ